MKLRPATNRDCAAVQEVVFGILREYGLPPDPGHTDQDLADIEGFYLRRGGSFDVMEDESGRVIASVGLLPLGDGRCELRKMYLLPSQRGKGLGKRLLEHALKRARELGFSRVELETASPLKEAIALYEAYGFRPLHREIEVARCDQAYYLDL